MQKKKNKTEKATFIYHFSMFYGYTFAGYFLDYIGTQVSQALLAFFARILFSTPTIV
jgi:hypothetical protein